MAVTKCTMFFELVTNTSGESQGHRIAGWSENWYSLNNNVTQLRNEFNELCRRRATFLPIGAYVVAQRYQFIDPVGATGQTTERFPGTTGQCDVPQMGIYFTLPGVGVPNVRKTTLRGIPDARVIEGEYKPSTSFLSSFNLFVSQLQFFNFRANNLTTTRVPITSISPLGVFVLQQPLTFNPNDYLNVFDVTVTGGVKVSGRFHVATRVDSQNGTLSNWTAGAGIGGTVRRDLVIYPAISVSTDPPTFKVVVRKVGRPLGGYRGRASRRV